ncbi:hypothetical protein B0H13DRAFT_2514469 [Mycena leptocephala]|nr:hypothetical protein B0H13DRAFT_2514469 [Mycena leptocephala]
MDSSSYDALSALGAPLTLEEYTRLANGPLGDALAFLSEHLVGRHAAASARTTLFLSAPSSFQVSYLIEYKNDSAHEAQAKSQLKQPATTRSRADKAVARLAAAKTSSAVHTNQLAELREKMQASGALSFISILCGLADLFIAAARLAALQRTLAAKRRLLLLLNVLETKHTLRTQRIKALTQKIGQLRQTLPQTNPVSIPPLLLPSPSPFPARISHTRDRLAALHRLASPHPDPRARLSRAVARILATDTSHPDTKRVVQRCIAFAERRAAVEFKSQNNQNENGDVRVLDAKSQANKAKATKLQSLVERCAALGVGCVGEVGEISMHTSAFASLRQSLQAESEAAKGHVEALRGVVRASPEVDDRKRKRKQEESFAGRVKHACRMSQSATTRAVLEEVGRVVRRANRRQRLLDSGTSALVVPSGPSSVDIATRTAQHARGVELITRKAAKAGLGRERAREVEGVVKDWRGVVGSSVGGKEK